MEKLWDWDIGMEERMVSAMALFHLVSVDFFAFGPGGLS